MNISEDQNKDQCFNTILSAYVKSYVEKLYEADKLLDDLIIDEKGPRHEFQVLSDIIKDLTDAKTALNKYLMVDQINKDLNMAKEDQNAKQ